MSKLVFTVQKFDITEIGEGSHFTKLKLYIASEGMSLNDIGIDWSAIENATPTLIGKPILCSYNVKKNDFNGHDSDEVAVGMFISNDETEMEVIDGKRWLTATGYIWKKYYPEVVDVLIRKGNETSISMEIEYYGIENRNDVPWITKFDFDGVTLIGIEPGIKNAKAIVTKFSQLKSDLEKEFGKSVTNFPSIGDNKRINLFNSKFPQFDRKYAEGIKEKRPDIWEKSGNIRGNESFDIWKKAIEGDTSEKVISWIKEREAWAERHQKNKNIAGIVAAMKWGVIISRGLQYMKDQIDLEIDKRDKIQASYFDARKEKLDLKQEKDENEVVEDKFVEEKREEENFESEEKSEEEQEPENKESEEVENKTDDSEDKETEDEKEEDFSLDAYLDVAAALEFLNQETEKNKDLIEEFSKESEKQDKSKIVYMLFEKYKSMFSEMQKMREDSEVYMAELEDLRNFKGRIEKESKNSEVEMILNECVSIGMSQDEIQRFRDDSANFSLADIDAWKNIVRAKAFLFSKGKDSVDTKEHYKKIPLPFTESNNKPVSPWRGK